MTTPRLVEGSYSFKLESCLMLHQLKRKLLRNHPNLLLLMKIMKNLVKALAHGSLHYKVVQTKLVLVLLFVILFVLLFTVGFIGCY